MQLGESSSQVSLSVTWEFLCPVVPSIMCVSWVRGSFTWKNWLSGMDSNHDKELQRLLCYHYTTGQSRPKLAFRRAPRKGKVGLLVPENEAPTSRSAAFMPLRDRVARDARHHLAVCLQVWCERPKCRVSVVPFAEAHCSHQFRGRYASYSSLSVSAKTTTRKIGRINFVPRAITIREPILAPTS